MTNGPLTVLVLGALIGVAQLTPVELQTSGCNVDGQRYDVGQSWNVGCEMRCFCHRENNWGCVSMCPLVVVNFPCRMVPNPKRDEANGLHCCDIPECRAGCFVDGVHHNVGEAWNIGCNSRCVCRRNGSVSCLPMCAPVVVSPPCRMAPNPDKDEARGRNCCDVAVCPEATDWLSDMSACNVTRQICQSKLCT